MQMTQTQLIITILLIILGTMFTRFISFIVFPPSKPVPSFINYLGNVLPKAMMSFLLIYCLKGVSVLKAPHALPEIISLGFVTILHIWKNNTLLSIAGGTIMYMFLVQMIF